MIQQNSEIDCLLTDQPLQDF